MAVVLQPLHLMHSVNEDFTVRLAIDQGEFHSKMRRQKGGGPQQHETAAGLLGSSRENYIEPVMLPRVPEMARPRAVSATMQTTAIRARSRPYSASACPSSRSNRAMSAVRASFILKNICPSFPFFGLLFPASQRVARLSVMPLI